MKEIYILSDGNNNPVYSIILFLLTFVESIFDNIALIFLPIENIILLCYFIKNKLFHFKDLIERYRWNQMYILIF